MGNNRIHRPNVVTRRAAAELTGVVTLYREVHPNNKNNENNNHTSLVKLFQPSTLRKLRQLSHYTNTDPSDAAHHLDAEVVAVEVTYTMTNMQPGCSGGGESERVPNTFKEAMALPQAVRWMAESDKKIASLEKHGVFKMVSILSVRYKGDHYHKPENYTEDAIQRYGMEGCISTYNPRVGLEQSLNRPEEPLLSEGGEAVLPWNRCSCDVPRINHSLRYSLRGQPDGDDHI